MTRPHCQNRAACKAAKPTTHCRSCSIARVRTDPELESKRLEGMREYLRDPANLAAHAKRVSESRRRKMESDPDFRERMVELGRKQAREKLNVPGSRAHDPEVRKRAGRTCSERRLAWCPPELRAEYIGLLRKGIPAAEARAIMGAEIERNSPAAEARRTIDRITAEMHAKRKREREQAY